MIHHQNRWRRKVCAENPASRMERGPAIHRGSQAGGRPMGHAAKSLSTRTCALPRVALTLLAAVCLDAGDARAFEFDTGSPDWRVRWDNTLQYNLGVRTQQRNSSIANNPLFSESEAKFDQGQLVTNRLALLSEFDASYATLVGVRVSGSGWNDFAYDDTVRYQTGNALPPVVVTTPGGPLEVAPA